MSVSNATQPLTTVEGQFGFRVVGRHSMPVIQIRSLPCTIGAGERCTLRLRAAGVQKLHCGIIWKDGACQVQRVSVDTWLNGRSFRTATLRPGDVLRIGPIELEILELPSVRTAPAAAPYIDACPQPEMYPSLAETATGIETVEPIQPVDGRATAQVAPMADGESDFVDSTGDSSASVPQPGRSPRDSNNLAQEPVETVTPSAAQQSEDAIPHQSLNMLLERAGSATGESPPSPPENAMLPDWEDLRAQLNRITERLEKVDTGRTAAGADWDAAVHDLQTRLRELNAEQEAEMSRWDVWQHDMRQVSDQTTARLSLIEDCLKRLDDRQDRAEGHRQTLEAELSRLIENLSGRGRQIDDQLGQLEQQRGAFAVEMQHWIEEQQLFRSAFTTWSETFSQHQEQLAIQRQELDALREEWQSEQQQLRQQFHSQVDELEQRFAQLESERRQLWEQSLNASHTFEQSNADWEKRLERTNEALVDVESRLATLIGQHEAWASRQDEHERLVAERLATVEVRARELTDLDCQWRAEQQLWRQQSEQTGSQLAARLQSLAQKVETLAVQHQHSAADQQAFRLQWEAAQEQARQCAAEWELRWESLHRARAEAEAATNASVAPAFEDGTQLLSQLEQRLEQLQSQVERLQSSQESHSAPLVTGSVDDWEPVPSIAGLHHRAAMSDGSEPGEPVPAGDPPVAEVSEEVVSPSAAIPSERIEREVEGMAAANSPGDSEEEIVSVPETHDSIELSPDSHAMTRPCESDESEPNSLAGAATTPSEECGPSLPGEDASPAETTTDEPGPARSRLVELGILSPDDEFDLYGSADRRDNRVSPQESHGPALGEFGDGDANHRVEPRDEGAEGEDASIPAAMSASDLLSRLGGMPNLTEDAPEEAAVPEQLTADLEDAAPATNSGLGSSFESIADAAPHVELLEEDSVEDYMSRLLARVRGDAVPQSSFTATRPKVEPQPQSPVVQAPQPKSIDEGAAEPALLDMGQFTPRHKPPELNRDLSAMRDLANRNARDALNIHSRQQLKSETAGTFGVALVAILASFTLMWLSTHAGMLTYWASLISLLIAGIFGIKYLYMTGQIYAQNSEDDDDDDYDDDEDE